MGLKILGYELKKTGSDNLLRQQINSQIANYLTANLNYFTETPEPIADGVDAYASVADVYAIIQYIAQKFSTVPVYVYRMKDKKAYRQYKTAVKNKQIKDAAKFQAKAMDEELTDNPISTILNRPNLQQAQDSFMQQVMGFRLSGGAAPVWMNKGEGQTGEPVALHCLIPSKVEFKPMNGNPFYREQFMFDEIGMNLKGDVKDLIYWPYWSPKFDTSTYAHLYGFSPLQAAAFTMSSNQEAQKAAFATFHNKGANGMIFPNMGAELVPDTQMSKIREDVNRFINNPNQRGGVMAMRAPMGYIDLGMTAGEMELIKAMNLTKRDLCNVFQFPYQLFDSDTTFNNVQQAGKQLITNKIIPEWNSFADQLNQQLIPQFKGTGGYVIEPDFSQMYEMQEDVKFMVDTMTPLFDRGIVNGNDIRNALGYDESKVAEHDEYFINGNYTPIGEASMPISNGDI